MTHSLFRYALLGTFTLVAPGCDGVGEDERGSEVAPPTVTAELPEGAEALSLLGEPLYPATQSGEAQAANQANLDAALADLAASPGDADALIWVGRRHGYLGHYQAAIGVFSEGHEWHPDDPRFLRHRGHRFLSTRRLDLAIADLQQASAMIEDREDEVEPDGQPNRLGIPLSTLHFNIWYHLGLAHYLSGDFELAHAAYRECHGVSRNDDSRVAASYWLYLILRRLGRDAEADEVLAEVSDNLEIIENTAYRDLLLLFKGELRPEDLLSEGDDALQNTTVAYGVGAWYAVNGDTEQAGQIWDRILETGPAFAFGYIAAEAEVARMDPSEGP
jgi:tetratricopeptide (TPR) repeat protein